MRYSKEGPFGLTYLVEMWLGEVHNQVCMQVVRVNEK